MTELGPRSQGWSLFSGSHNAPAPSSPQRPPGQPSRASSLEALHITACPPLLFSSHRCLPSPRLSHPAVAPSPPSSPLACPPVLPAPPIYLPRLLARPAYLSVSLACFVRLPLLAPCRRFPRHYAPVTTVFRCGSRPRSQPPSVATSPRPSPTITPQPQPAAALALATRCQPPACPNRSPLQPCRSQPAADPACLQPSPCPAPNPAPAAALWAPSPLPRPTPAAPANPQKTLALACPLTIARARGGPPISNLSNTPGNSANRQSTGSSYPQPAAQFANSEISQRPPQIPTFV